MSLPHCLPLWVVCSKETLHENAHGFFGVLWLVAACSDEQSSTPSNTEGVDSSNQDTNSEVLTDSDSDSSSDADSDADSDTDTDTDADSDTDTDAAGDCTAVLLVDTSTALEDALDNTAPGHCIRVASGSYTPAAATTVHYATIDRSVYYYSQGSGTEELPILIESQDPDDKAVFEGLASNSSAYILWINGEHWIVRNLVLQTGGKGFMLDEASNSVVSGVEVYNVGDEGIHLRSGTSNAIIENCVIDGTGLEQPGFGEGIYIGSDNNQWDYYEAACDNNTVRSCTIRNTKAEAVDAKEGTTQTVIEDCQIYGIAISGENYADSFIDLKGDAGQVRNNVFYKENNSTVTRGVAIVERLQGPTATNNWICDNEFFMDNDTGLMVHAYAGINNYAWSNSRTTSGEEYAGDDPELYFIDSR